MSLGGQPMTIDKNVKLLLYCKDISLRKHSAKLVLRKREGHCSCNYGPSCASVGRSERLLAL
jgi:hypothetical protein